MNDPHVEALIYVVEHDKSSDYSRASAIEIEHLQFRLKLKDGEARFEVKEHYPTRQQAERAIKPFIDQWELRASLESGPGTFALKLKRDETIDRKPTPGVISVSASPISWRFIVGSPTVTVTRQYPHPPPECRMNISNPDVQTMLHQYLGYREGREPLPSMAYFCYEVFAKRLGNDSEHAARRHKLSHKLVKMVGNLASNKGGDQARKQSGICHPLTQSEVQFLQKAVGAMIVRAAMVAADPSQPMETIDSSNLFAISPWQTTGSQN